jgi:hypothetical protein
MFGSRKAKRYARNETFSPHRLRNAALAGLGMLAWKWWRNRQDTPGRTRTNPENSFSATRGSSGGAF